MSSLINIARGGSTLAAGGLAVLALSLPAAAAGGTGQGNPDGNGTRTDIGRLLNDVDTPIVPGSSTSPGTSPAESGSSEVLPITLGALGGAAIIAGGAVVIVRRRHHHLPHAA